MKIFFKLLFTFLILVFGCQYFQIKIYQFSKPTVFQGDSLYNPYAGDPKMWLKGNFHAHAIAWNGLTNGNQTGNEVVNQYQKFGYDISCISDYEWLNPHIYVSGNVPIPVYEHGMNISKNHQLVLGSDWVTFFDVMLWQNRSIKQYIIEKLKSSSKMLCLAHPNRRNAYSVTDLSYLTGYNCMEILSRERPSLKEWDAALSAGRPVWLMANDDCHHIYQNEFARCWTMVQVEQRSPEAVIKAIKSGKAYAMRRNENISGNSLFYFIGNKRKQILKSVTNTGNTIYFKFTRPVRHIRLIGQQGALKAEAFDTDQMQYTFNKEDTYIRSELETEKVQIFLNPILRYNGKQVPENMMKAKIQILPTLLFRVFMVTLVTGLLTLLHWKTVLWILYGKMPSELFNTNLVTPKTETLWKFH